MPGFNPFDVTTKRVLKKLGGDKNQTKAFVLPEVSLAEDAETPGFTVYRDLSNASPFELGKTYTVHLDSGSYECVAKAMDDIGNVLGNTAFGGGDDTGETFLVAIAEGIAMVMDANCGTKASVTANVETIVPIDRKYLPGVCLPVVELSTTFEDGASYTVEENAKLKEVWEAGTPAIIKCSASLGITNLDDTRFVWNMFKTSFVCAYMVPYGSSMLQIYSVDMGKTWGCTIEQIG